MNDMQLTEAEIQFILSPKAIRERASLIFERTVKGNGFFVYNPSKLKATVDYVMQVIRHNYPNLEIPFHSRWGHFQAGGIDRKAQLLSAVSSLDKMEQARVQIDLVVTSVLLDAGAGQDWSYQEVSSGQSFSRSEGLGVASFHMFMSKIMSSEAQALRVEAEGLKRISVADFNSAFQVSDQNQLVGIEGRVELLNRLGQVLGRRTMFRDGRPGNILDFLVETYGERIPASGILRAVLEGFGEIWPGRVRANGRSLGDVWVHSQLKGQGEFNSIIPFHKLSQWLTYSLIEPITSAGIEVFGIEDLTGLAEYRNGGLFIDSELITLRDSEKFEIEWQVGSDLVIEWRAMTVYLLDRVGTEIQKELGQTASSFPLAKVLEGGTWWAGRFLARDRRPGGVSPIKVRSDGTVF